jgi:multidrug efflux pump subunit AcrB
MHISELVFKRKAIFNFLLVALVIGGVFSFINISKLEDPEITVMQAQVVTVYPGASAHDVEMQLTKVIEEELSDLPGLENLKSTSSPNVSSISVGLSIDVPQDEINEVWTLLRRKMENVQSKLPKGAQEPIVFDDIGDVYGMFYGMTAEGFSYEEMEKYATMIERELRKVEGVNKVQIYGAQKPSIDIQLSNDKMSELGVFPMQIFSAIQDHNKHVYPGNLRTGEQQMRMHIDAEFTSIEDIEDLIIKSTDGKNFRLADVATIKRTYKEPIHNTFFINNKKALGISVSMASGENIIDVGKDVEKRLEELKPQIPLGFEFQKVFFQPDKVQDSINGFMWNLIASVLIVVVVLMFTMGLRSGLIIGGGLVLTILATFPILMAAGGTLQRISLGAFIVAMGMLVDNAIVVIDGILVDLQKNGRTKKSFVNAAKRTAMPLLGATLIAIVAFLPVYLSPDTAGTYVRDLFVVLCISLMISWLLSLTQVPLFSAKFLRLNPKKKDQALYQGGFYKVISKILGFSLKFKFVVISIGVALLIFAAWGYRFVQDTFFPDFNYNQVYIEYKLPAGTSPDKVNEDLKAITDHFLTYDEVKLVATSQGMTPTRYCLVRALGDVADHYGELIVNFEDYETMIEMKPKLEKYLNDQYPDAYMRIRKYNLSVKSSHTIEVEYSGPDPSVLRDLSRQAQDIMLASDYINSSTVNDDWNAPQKSMAVHMDQNAASRVGITRSDVSNALLAATDGLPIGTLYEGEQEVEISFKSRDIHGNRILDLGDVPVWPMLPNVASIGQDQLMGLYSGATSVEEISKEIISPVPLSSVTYNLSMEPEEGGVVRLNGQRTIQAQCDPVDGFSPVDATKDIQVAIEAIELPEGYQMKWVGESELKTQGTKNIFSFLPISVALMIIILILLFNDYKKPIIVMLVIPMAAIGIVPGHVLTGVPFSFVSIIGAFGLMGMLIKNSIVLIDEIGKQIKDGEGRYTAIVNATISRVRPVLMASITTIFGMLPLFLDPMYKSMAVTIISGLLIGTLITLVFVPVLYAVFHRVKNTETQRRFSQLSSTPKSLKA